MEQALLISSVLLWALVLFNLLLTLALVRKVNASAEERKPAPLGLKVGDKAPDFVAQTLTGGTVTLSQFAGRPTAFLFIQPDCQPCREGLPEYISLHATARDAGAELVLVSIASAEYTREFVDENQVGLPVLVAHRNDSSFAEDYKMRGTPSYTYIDAQGRIESVGRPNKNTREWQAVIRSWEATRKEPAGASSNGRG
ncbi:MAG TPA: redoxin domain-containing protein [Chloroflexia bacterium]|jgi:peroxiredoxin